MARKGITRDRTDLKDIYLDYVGRMNPSNPVHQYLSQVSTGDHVQLKRLGEKLELSDAAGHPIAILSKGAKERWLAVLRNIESIKIIAMVERRAEDSQEAEFRKLLKIENWEVPIVEVTYSDAIF